MEYTFDYHFKGEEEVPSPALIFYRDQIERNIDGVIVMAGDPRRLWPHIKTHKTAEIVRMLMAKGVRRFKAATIAEAELCARSLPGTGEQGQSPYCELEGNLEVMMAYPLVGPAIARFIQLRWNYPHVNF